MKKLRIVICVALVALMTIIPFGCADTTQEGIVFSGWSIGEAANKDTLEAMVKSYNDKETTKDKVTPIVWPWGETVTQFANRYKGSEAFDVAQIDIRMLAPLAEAGYLANVTDLFGASYLTDNFDSSSLSVGKYKNVQYGIPWTIAPMTMIANPKILSEAGITTMPTTIAQFEAAMEAVKTAHPNNTDSDATNDILPYAAATKDAGTAAPDFMPWLWTFGGEIFNSTGGVTIDSAKAVEALTWFKSLKTNGYIKDAVGRGDARTLFATGKAAFYDDALLGKASILGVEGGSITNANLAEVARPIVRPVKTAGDTPKSLSWGHLLVIIKRSPKQAEAVDFIKHVISEAEALKYFTNNGLLPSVKTVLNSTTVTSDYWANAWKPVIATGRIAETATGTKEAAYNEAILAPLQEMLAGTKTPTEAAAAMKTGLNAA